MKIGAYDMDEILTIEGHYGPGIWKDGYYFNPLYVNAHKGLKEALQTGLYEGVPFKVTGHGKDIQRDDMYLAERNSGVQLLTCNYNDHENGWIMPVEAAYPYDTGECIRIELLIE